MQKGGMNANPLHQHLAGLSRPSEKEAAAPEFARQYPLRILIADDNYINRRVLSLLLQRFGYQTDSAESGQDCVAKALSTTYDLLLIDVDMPDISGIECTQQLRQAGRRFPIVAVTATDPDTNRKACLAAGMNDFITKPVQLSELKRVLRDASIMQAKSSPSSPSSVSSDDTNSAKQSGSAPSIGFHFAL
jgi:CheY-like chemotaxis protein